MWSLPKSTDIKILSFRQKYLTTLYDRIGIFTDVIAHREKASTTSQPPQKCSELQIAGVFGSETRAKVTFSARIYQPQSRKYAKYAHIYVLARTFCAHFLSFVKFQYNISSDLITWFLNLWPKGKNCWKLKTITKFHGIKMLS